MLISPNPIGTNIFAGQIGKPISIVLSRLNNGAFQSNARSKCAQLHHVNKIINPKIIRVFTSSNVHKTRPRNRLTNRSIRMWVPSLIAKLTARMAIKGMSCIIQSTYPLKGFSKNSLPPTDLTASNISTNIAIPEMSAKNLSTISIARSMRLNRELSSIIEVVLAMKPGHN